MYCPVGFKYLKSHLWFRQIGKHDIQIGITDFIQKEIGRIESLEIENEGIYIGENHLFGKLFGTNHPFLLRMPVSGKLLSINTEIIEKPDVLNIDAYQNWIAIISVNTTNPINAIGYWNEQKYSAFVHEINPHLNSETYNFPKRLINELSNGI